ncbi:thiamin pyrophosphokinase 1-like [Rhopilema esculentum]|uniref:thiamin pyrophosphokinase 1-like n=1 Tax=Rhopilema esculentum TaxID=499914 RepID=UPI0031D6F081
MDGCFDNRWEVKGSVYIGTGMSRLGNSVWLHQKPLYCLLDRGVKTGLILLNRPLKEHLPILKHLWKNSVIKLCADGGLNRLHDAIGEDSDRYIPEIISGDFDSAVSDLLTHYKSKGSMIVPTPSQDETDFTKGLHVMCQALKEKNMQEEYSCIVALGAFGGRLDHLMSNINALYTAAETQDKPCYLMSSTEITCLLQSGSHILHLDSGFEGDWCGLIPVGNPAEKVYTQGLKWNLDGQSLAFGSLISTSNQVVSKEVRIETTNPLLFTLGINYK